MVWFGELVCAIHLHLFFYHNVNMFASLKKKCLGSYQGSTINLLKSKKKKKKKTSMIPAFLLQMLPDVQPNDGGYDCDNDGFIFFQ